MASEHVVIDRTTAQKYGIFVDNDRAGIQTSVGSDDGEPIVEDDVDSGSYFKFFVDNGRLSIESTVTEQDDLVSLDDATTNKIFKLVVRAGRWAIEQIVSNRSIYKTVKHEVVVRVAKINYQSKVTKWIR